MKFGARGLSSTSHLAMRNSKGSLSWQVFPLCGCADRFLIWGADCGHQRDAANRPCRPCWSSACCTTIRRRDRGRQNTSRGLCFFIHMSSTSVVQPFWPDVVIDPPHRRSLAKVLFLSTFPSRSSLGPTSSSLTAGSSRDPKRWTIGWSPSRRVHGVVLALSELRPD